MNSRDAKDPATQRPERPVLDGSGGWQSRARSTASSCVGTSMRQGTWSGGALGRAGRGDGHGRTDLSVSRLGLVQTATMELRPSMVVPGTERERHERRGRKHGEEVWRRRRGGGATGSWWCCCLQPVASCSRSPQDRAEEALVDGGAVDWWIRDQEGSRGRW